MVNRIVTIDSIIGLYSRIKKTQDTNITKYVKTDQIIASISLKKF